MRGSLEQQVVAARDREPDPVFDGVSDACLVEGFARHASELAASTCRWLLMLAEIVRRGAWAPDGAASPAAWLSWKVGMAGSTAREHVRVALALADWPRVRAEFEAGRLSYTKVRAIVSCDRPELDRVLVEFAHAASGEQLQRICRRFVSSDVEPAVDTWAARDVSRRDLPGGMSELRLVAPTADVDAAWLTLDRRAEQRRREQPQSAAAAADDPEVSGAAAAAPEPRSCRRADALFDAIAGLDDGRAGDWSGQDRHLVVLHTTAAALEEPQAGQDRLETVTDDRGRTPALSARVLRRLSCAGGRVVEHDADGEVAVVRDERRAPTPRQRRQLWLRDRGCRFPSCTRTRGLHAHHVVHWSDGGPTELHNLVLLCGTHHRFVHEREWTISTDGRGRFSFAPPAGERVPYAAPPLGATAPELVFPEWPEEIPDDVEPWVVWPRTPLEPAGAVARPDDNACLEVLHAELERLRRPAPDEVLVAA